MCPLESSFKMMKILESHIEKEKKRKKKREIIYGYIYYILIGWTLNWT